MQNSFGSCCMFTSVCSTRQNKIDRLTLHDLIHQNINMIIATTIRSSKWILTREIVAPCPHIKQGWMSATDKLLIFNNTETFLAKLPLMLYMFFACNLCDIKAKIVNSYLCLQMLPSQYTAWQAWKEWRYAHIAMVPSWKTKSSFLLLWLQKKY